jgi:hypothetical protein
MRVV